MKQGSKVYQSYNCYQAICAVDINFLCVFKQKISCWSFVNCSSVNDSTKCCTSPFSLAVEEENLC